MALSPPTIIHGAPNDEGKRRVGCVGCVGFVAHAGLLTGGVGGTVKAAAQRAMPISFGSVEQPAEPDFTIVRSAYEYNH